MKIIIIIFLVHFPLSSFCLAKADFSGYYRQSKKRSSVELPVWQVRNSYEQGISGTGFFVEKNLFVTNFHVLLSLLKTRGIQDIVLVQEEGSSVLKVEEVLALSAFYDLALFKIRGKVSRHLEVSQRMPKANAPLFVPVYLSDGTFGKIKKTGAVFYEDDQSYIFPVNHCDLSRVNGGPVLNSSEKVVGISFQSEGENILAVIKPKPLKDFIANKEGLNCSHFKDVESCVKKEIDNLKHIAKEGYPGALTHLIRLMHYVSEGNDKDFELAVRGLLKIKDPVHAKTQHLLARMHYSGIGTERNIQRAFDLWIKAAKQNYVLAQYNLANKKIKKDSAWAFQWLFQAANLGYVKAQFDLGMIYYEVKNFETASFFLNQAADQSYARAKTFLRELQIDGKLSGQTSEKM